jgi:hypothetical protein
MKALVQTHCHHKAVLDAEKQQQMFEAMGLELQPNPTGCCGHAGSFGYETEHYPVSMTIAEQELFPAVRNAGGDTLIVADGFSCREQIAQCTDRHALHLAEVIQMALTEGPDGREGPFPEQELVHNKQAAVRDSMKKAAFAMAGLAAGGALLWAFNRRK